MLQAVQHESRGRESNQSDATTQGTSLIYGTGATYTNLLFIDGGITDSCTQGLQRALPFLLFPEAERHPKCKSKSVIAE